MKDLEDEVQLNGDTQRVHQHILDICCRSLDGWQGLQLEQVQFSPISGGISNILVKVAPNNPQLAPVAVKVFGEKTELLIDRDAERRVVVDLSAQGFGPKVLAMFHNGRVEEFLPCITLTPQQMCDPHFVPRIAALLRRFHAADIHLPRTPTLWGVIGQWLAQAQQLTFTDAAKAAAYAQLDFRAMAAEIQELQQLCDTMESPVVFGHNDLLSGNLLVVQEPGFDPEAADLNRPLTVIDFEYGAYTYRGFDIGNHFNEYAGFECDYTRYPDRDRQRLFFEHYMADPSSSSSSSSQAAAGNAGLAQGSTQASSSSSLAVPRVELSEEQLDALCAEANVFALASHVYWGVWAIVQARYSPIDFDYMSYSSMRWAEFHRRKEEFVGQARAVVAQRAAAPAALAAVG